MSEPKWAKERPNAEAIKALWRYPVFDCDGWYSPAIDELVHELRDTHVNGGAFFARFSFPIHPVIEWFLSRSAFGELGFFEHLLTSDTLRNALPELKAPATLQPINWEWWSPYLLGGDWARTLMSGGAYIKFKKGARAAKELGDRVCSDLFGDRFEEVMIFRSGQPWSEWFCGVAWDMTWLGLDKRESRIW